MTLLFTIFALVFLTQLISWIGQSVLLEVVRVFDFGGRGFGLTSTCLCLLLLFDSISSPHDTTC